MVRVGHKKHGFHIAVHGAVHANHLKFILKIRDGAQTSNNDTGADLFGTVDQQVFKRMNLDLDLGVTRDSLAFGADPGDEFVELTHRSFFAINGHPDDEPVHQRAGASDDINMTERYRVKRAGIETYAHLFSSYSSLLSQTVRRVSDGYKLILGPRDQ